MKNNLLLDNIDYEPEQLIIITSNSKGKLNFFSNFLSMIDIDEAIYMFLMSLWFTLVFCTWLIGIAVYVSIVGAIIATAIGLLLKHSIWKYV